MEVTSKVASLTNDIVELQQRLADNEEAVAATTRLAHTHEDQLAVLQGKIEDIENRQRRNNLTLFDVPEGKDGSDPSAFVVHLFQAAFPDLSDWDWDSQIQLAHRLPIFLN